MIQLARCYESFKFLVKVKWEGIAQGTPPRGGYTHLWEGAAHTVQGVLMPICNTLMATLVKGHIP